MVHKILQVVKLILAGISVYLAYYQYTHQNMNYVAYWFIVAVYWVLNYISGLEKD